MSLRKSGKILTVVGFVVCLSCMGILYGNLSTISVERDELLSNKNKEISNLRAQLENKDTSLFSAKNRISLLEKESSQYQQLHKSKKEEGEQLQTQLNDLKSQVRDLTANIKEEQENVKELNMNLSLKSEKIRKLETSVDELDEGGKTCSSSLSALQFQVNEQAHKIVELKKQVTDCGQVSKSNLTNNLTYNIIDNLTNNYTNFNKLKFSQRSSHFQNNTQEVKEDLKKADQEPGNKFDAVVAVPEAAEDHGNQGDGNQGAQVAPVPQQLQERQPVVDSQQGIPGAQAAAPQAQQNLVLQGGEHDEQAVAPQPVQQPVHAPGGPAAPVQPADNMAPVAAPGPAEDPAIQPAQPAQDAAIQPAQPAQDAAIQPVQPDQDAAIQPAQPAQDPAIQPVQPAQDAAIQPAHPAQDSAIQPVQSAQDPAILPVQPAEPLQPAVVEEKRAVEPQNQEQLQKAVDTVRAQQLEQLEQLQEQQKELLEQQKSKNPALAPELQAPLPPAV